MLQVGKDVARVHSAGGGALPAPRGFEEAVGATTVGRAVTQLIDVVGLLELALLSTVLALVVVVLRFMEGAVVAAACCAAQSAVGRPAAVVPSASNLVV